MQEAEGNSFVFHARGHLQKEMDRFGVWIEYLYEGDKLVHILHKEGKGIRLFYEEGHLQRAEGPGLLLAYHLDPQGLLIKVEDARDVLYFHTYDEDKRLCVIEDGRGFPILQASYDIYGRATLLQEGPLACQQIFDLLQGEEVVRYGQDYQVQKTFTEDAKISRVEDSLQRSWELTYTDRHTMPSCITKPSGAKTRYDQDALGRLTGIYREDGSAKHFWYDEKGRLFATQHPDGSYTLTFYDDKDRVVGQASGPCVTREGDTLLWRYDKNHCTLYEYEEDSSLIKSVIHARGTDHYSYNDLGECTLCEYADGTWRKMFYTTTGYLEKEEESTGFYCSYTHDTRGCIQSISTHISTVEYIKQGSTELYKDGLGHITKYLFNEFNQIAEIIDAKGGRTCCFYDSSGHLEKLIFPNGSSRTIECHKDQIRDR
ncbi:MAG: RHS repeat protein [Chlamydiae bacterium]|nr:RHS repeat protein [Chlamydiota bacterium]